MMKVNDSKCNRGILWSLAPFPSRDESSAASSGAPGSPGSFTHTEAISSDPEIVPEVPGPLLGMAQPDVNQATRASPQKADGLP